MSDCGCGLKFSGGARKIRKQSKKAHKSRKIHKNKRRVTRKN